MAPTFDEAISQPLNKIKLPSLKSTDFWNSPAYQSLMNLNQAVEAEAAGRRASLPAARPSPASPPEMSKAPKRAAVSTIWWTCVIETLCSCATRVIRFFSCARRASSSASVPTACCRFKRPW